MLLAVNQWQVNIKRNCIYRFSNNLEWRVGKKIVVESQESPSLEQLNETQVDHILASYDNFYASMRMRKQGIR